MCRWKEIPECPGYFVSDSGQVKSVLSGKERVLKQSFDGAKHYLHVCLRCKGVYKTPQVHRLVAELFVKNTNPEVNNTVDHINCVKTDNRACNLEWVSHCENMRRARKHGRIPAPPTYKGKFGAKHNRSVGYKVVSPSGTVSTYYSGLEFTRKTGFDNTTLSYAATHFSLPYVFKRGKLKGYVLVEVFKPYTSK